jgi:MFS transporter, DHA1 family, multidrug resistance protein
MLGWSMATPAITLMVLDLFPERRGMASSLQAFVGSLINAVVAGVIAPLVMHSALGLAVASLTMLLIGAVLACCSNVQGPDRQAAFT